MRVARFFLGCALLMCGFGLLQGVPRQHTVSDASRPVFLGFDRNEYPGDAALPVLRKVFSFTSYWLNAPPGEKRSGWLRKRSLLRSQGFGFLVLFNGPDSRSLKSGADAQHQGALDAQRAARLARAEGFAAGTVLFLDIEEGGRLPGNYHQYLGSWFKGIGSANFLPGVYCSAMPVTEGPGVSITTAQDIQDDAAWKNIRFWVYNDACPPAPGCSFAAEGLHPASSGFASTAVWQYAQSPRRKEFTKGCAASYAPDGNCYAPEDDLRKWFLDLNVAGTDDPSSGKN